MPEASPPPKYHPPPKRDGEIGGALILAGGARLRVLLSAVGAAGIYLFVALFGSFSLDSPAATHAWMVYGLMYGLPTLVMLPSLLSFGAQALTVVELLRSRRR